MHENVFSLFGPAFSLTSTNLLCVSCKRVCLAAMLSINDVQLHGEGFPTLSTFLKRRKAC